MRMAAWWKRTSTPLAALATVSRSRMSPSISSTFPVASADARFARRPRTKLSSTTMSTSADRASWSAMVEPIMPAPPVMRTRAPSRLDVANWGESSVTWPPKPMRGSGAGAVCLAMSRKGDQGATLVQAAAHGVEHLEDPQTRLAAGGGGPALADRGDRLADHAPERLGLGQRRGHHVADAVGDERV